MQYQLRKTLVIMVSFNDEEFDFIDKSIKGSREYQHLAECGHWWYGYNNYRNWDKKNVDLTPYDFEFRHLNIILKCLEPYICFDYKNPINSVITKNIYTILNSVNDYHIANQEAEIINTEV